MTDIIIVVVLLAIAVFAIRGTRAHLKGEGACCGGGSKTVPEKKKLTGEKIGEKIIYIEGMHCENCKNTVERHINRIEGAVARVNLKKKLAVVEMDREIAEEELIAAVERADFKVIRVE